MKRMPELDAIRGLAALTVVISHFAVYSIFDMAKGDIEPFSFMYIYNYTPLRIIHAGHEAVILFFILSGFVLTLSYSSESNFNIISFLFKRFSRIYIPVFVMLLVTIVFKLEFYQVDGLFGLSDWINSKWVDSINEKMLFNHFTLIFNYDYSNGLNPVLWSLTHELRFYILFPVLIYMLMRINIIFFIFLIVILMYTGYEGLISKLGWSFSIPYGLHVTLIYLPVFLCGILLAKYFKYIKYFYIKYLNTYFKILLLLCAVYLYTYELIFQDIKSIHNAYIDNISVILGASVFVITTLSSRRVSNVLSTRVFIFLGEISYSLYLYHLIILLASLHIFYGLVSTWLILIFAFVTTIVISYFSYKYIEMPSILYVKKLIN